MRWLESANKQKKKNCKGTGFAMSTKRKRIDSGKCRRGREYAFHSEGSSPFFDAVREPRNSMNGHFILFGFGRFAMSDWKWRGFEKTNKNEIQLRWWWFGDTPKRRNMNK
jgi:hypothetical protein